MIRAWLLTLVMVTSPIAADPQVAPLPATPSDDTFADVWPIMASPMTGDLDAMIARGEIRILTTFSLGWYYIDGGHPMGITYENGRNFEAFARRILGAPAKLLKVTLIPVRRDQLIPYLVQGYGDLIFANLTVTERRQGQIAFSAPISDDTQELIVTTAEFGEVTSLHQLAGKQVTVRRESSYYDSLMTMNERLKRKGRTEIQIDVADPRLEDEDLLKFVSSGVFQATVVDKHKLPVWLKRYPNLITLDAVPIRTDAQVAYGLRQHSPQLQSLMDRYATTYRTGGHTVNVLHHRFLQDDRWLTHARSSNNLDTLAQLQQWFQTYAEQYQFDWVLLASFAYQESKFKQTARSSAGAVGIMQVLPSTAADKQVAIKDIHKPENNIHAGTKYLSVIRSRYFDDEALSPFDQMIFSIAAYNAGPNRINRLRQQASQRGLDPNRWFGNVEYLAAARIGSETVNYVANIYRYYIVYKRGLSELGQKRQLQRAMEGGGNSGSLP
ncbi:Membrane-bound lytic murein transglycosylase MltF [Ferrimonas sediminum]|uniref:Membrane-bound lytic murein transglycosylase MltF n=1 Tax=Ferrimonas sediminum TaxID=718193 RepID=A0A1G8VE57_9GAMM|nr:transglycosylase SLT domain-containing protein [Ferrimonas sediminum]SDJ64204.1 Membrane-bound lytic murein transglycosylase MltF [Ferrimonas sediminum]